ncbi:MAG: HAD family hydrolase [Microcoleaceae cyanobacterium]
MNAYQPIQAFPLEHRQQIALIATDVDGTLTNQEKFPSILVQTLEQLAAAGIAVLLVTGRSAGWVQGLVHYLPVVGAIAENGGVFYQKDAAAPEILTPILDIAEHRRHLAQIFQCLQLQVLGLVESTDNPFRLTDWTFEIQQLSPAELKILSQLCHQQGQGFTYSTVQCHIKPQKQDKATGLRHVLSNYFPELQPQQVVTIGDSPNDESLFNPEYFPHSFGVANIIEYRSRLQYFPAYVTQATSASGFCELAQLLINLP